MKSLSIILTLCLTALSAGYKPIVLDPSYEHDKFVTLPKDHIRKFAAFTLSFDSEDDNDGDRPIQKVSSSFSGQFQHEITMEIVISKENFHPDENLSSCPPLFA